MITNSMSVVGFKGITGKTVDLSDGIFEVMLVKRPRSLEDLNRTLVALTQRDIDAACMYCFKTTCLKVESEEERRCISWYREKGAKTGRAPERQIIAGNDKILSFLYFFFGQDGV